MQPDNSTSMIFQILDICKEGSAKSEIMHKLSVSNSQLRRISAELVDKGFLHFSEPGIYITTKGYEFLGLKSKDGPRRQQGSGALQCFRKASVVMLPSTSSSNANCNIGTVSESSYVYTTALPRADAVSEGDTTSYLGFNIRLQRKGSLIRMDHPRSLHFSQK